MKKILPLFALLALLCGCDSKPNERLEINGKKYTISLGEVSFDADAHRVTIAVLADGQPLHNPAQHTSSSISVDGTVVSSSTSSKRPVRMLITINGRATFDRDKISASDDGIFTFEAEQAPERIDVFTDVNVGSTVYFDGKTRAVTGSPVVGD